MPGLVPGIHVLSSLKQEERGWPGKLKRWARLRFAHPAQSCWFGPCEERSDEANIIWPQLALRARAAERCAFLAGRWVARRAGERVERLAEALPFRLC
jgi:4'-phosphopantetheinyl transferase EntD